MGKIITVNRILWAVYLSLLAVLLPHTAWAFQQFEQDKTSWSWTAWAGAFAFEAAIAALTHKLSKYIEATPRRYEWWRKIIHRYVNVYSAGLAVALGISSLANLAHAVQFGGPMLIFTEWGVPSAVYSVAFGAVLPLVSLVFAQVLSNVVETEGEDDPQLIKANETIADLRRQLRESEQARASAEAGRRKAEERFAALGDLVAHLFAEDKRQKILAARALWPRLPGTAIALMTDSSPSYVSEVLSPADEAASG